MLKRQDPERFAKVRFPHRLDVVTSGLLLAAASTEAFDRLSKDLTPTAVVTCTSQRGLYDFPVAESITFYICPATHLSFLPPSSSARGI
eukprot:scaffold50907_cov39-Prasinocladus_malaysianus.AAC.1